MKRTRDAYKLMQQRALLKRQLCSTLAMCNWFAPSPSFMMQDEMESEGSEESEEESEESEHYDSSEYESEWEETDDEEAAEAEATAAGAPGQVLHLTPLSMEDPLLHALTATAPG